MSQRRVPYCADAQALAEIAIEVCERSITTFRMIIEVLRGRVDKATNIAMEEGRHGYERRQRKEAAINLDCIRNSHGGKTK